MFDYVSPLVFAAIILLLIVFGFAYSIKIQRKFGIIVSLKITKAATCSNDEAFYYVKITNKSKIPIVIKNAGLFSTEKENRHDNTTRIKRFLTYSDDSITQNNSFPILIEPKCSENIYFRCPIHLQGVFIDAYKTSYNDFDYSITEKLKGHSVCFNKASEFRKSSNGEPFLRIYKSCSFFLT